MMMMVRRVVAGRSERWWLKIEIGEKKGPSIKRTQGILATCMKICETTRTDKNKPCSKTCGIKWIVTRGESKT